MITEKHTSTIYAPGWAALLGLIFITLKLCHVIAWSWFWVLAPLWIPFTLMAFFFALALLFKILSE